MGKVILRFTMSFDGFINDQNYRLKPEPLQEVDASLAPFRRFWSAHVDALERQLTTWITQHHEKEDKEKKITNREQYTPGPASGAQVRKDGEMWTLIRFPLCRTARIGLVIFHP